MKGKEQETILHGKETAKKDSARINLRGELDSLHAQAIYTCVYARKYGYSDIVSGSEDVVRVARELVRSEALDEPPRVDHINGLSFDELRHISHHPKTELGVDHYFPDEYTDEMTALLNVLRTQIRRVERAAVVLAGESKAADGIQLVLNRLSSAAYILMLENRIEWTK